MQRQAERDVKDVPMHIKVDNTGNGGKTQKDVASPNLSDFDAQRRVLNTFAGGKATYVKYGSGTKLYRVGGKLGGYWSLEPPPATEYEWRVRFAIKQEFCNDATKLYTITIPEGSSITGLEGKVGSQGLGLYGQAHQAYIDIWSVPLDWIEVSPTNWLK